MPCQTRSSFPHVGIRPGKSWPWPLGDGSPLCPRSGWGYSRYQRTDSDHGNRTRQSLSCHRITGVCSQTHTPRRRRIDKPEDILPLVVHWADRPQEHFLVLSLNGAYEVLCIRVVSQGILDRTIVHPREVFVDPIRDRAAAIVCAHNHPSGSLEPSKEDKALTHRLQSAGSLLGIPLLDHVIFTGAGYYSFLEEKGLEE